MEKALQVLRQARRQSIERAASDRSANSQNGSANTTWQGRRETRTGHAMSLSLGWIVSGMLMLTVLVMAAWMWAVRDRALPENVETIRFGDGRIAVPISRCSAVTDQSGEEWVIIGLPTR